MVTKLIPITFVFECGNCGVLSRTLDGNSAEVTCSFCGTKHTVENPFAHVDLRLYIGQRPMPTAVAE